MALINHRAEATLAASSRPGWAAFPAMTSTPRARSFEKRAKSERDAEELGCPESDTKGNRQHGQTEKLSRTAVSNVVKYRRNDTSPDDNHDREESRQFTRRKPERAPDGLRLKQFEQVIAVKICPVDIATEHARP